MRIDEALSPVKSLSHINGGNQSILVPLPYIHAFMSEVSFSNDIPSLNIHHNGKLLAFHQTQHMCGTTGRMCNLQAVTCE